jgi:hypothetical protein
VNRPPAALAPLCFGFMPFGKKKGPKGRPEIDFDRIYDTALRPAILRARMPMFERLPLCDYSVADLTTANANVFYELGVRHAARPKTPIRRGYIGQL